MNLFLLVEPFAPTEIIGGDFRRIKREKVGGDLPRRVAPYAINRREANFYVKTF